MEPVNNQQHSTPINSYKHDKINTSTIIENKTLEGKFEEDNELNLPLLVENINKLLKQCKEKSENDTKAKFNSIEDKDGRSREETRLQNSWQNKNCKYYMSGKCKHTMGKGCEYKHPVLCGQLLNYGDVHESGCSLGKDCRYEHPVMCEQACKGEICKYGRNCWFRHPKFLGIKS